MGKYEALAKEIVQQIGGKENISSLTHCVTRLRFHLKDESRANDGNVKAIKGVVSLVKSSGQYQVVIGNHVPEVYEEVCKVANLSSQNTSVDHHGKQGVWATLINYISGIFGPCLAVLCASGMVKGFLSLFVFLGLMNEAQGMYQIINGIGDALFYFFPVLLGFSSASKFGMSPYLGAVIGAAFVYPDLQGVDLSVLGMTINVTYTSTVLPIIFTNILAAWLYKKFNKVIPDVVKTFLVPMLVMFIAVPIGFCVIGVAANWITQVITDLIMAVYGFSPLVAGLFLGTLWQILVIFGVHNGLVAIAIAGLMTTGSTPIFSTITATTLAQGAVVFAIWMKTKDKDLKAIALPAWISCIFGVSEPAIYGITLSRMKYFIISLIGAGLAGAWVGFTGVLTKVMGGLGIFALPSLLAQSTSDFINVCISILIAIVFSFTLTWIMYDENKPSKEVSKTSLKQKKLKA